MLVLCVLTSRLGFVFVLNFIRYERFLLSTM